MRERPTRFSSRLLTEQRLPSEKKQGSRNVHFSEQPHQTTPKKRHTTTSILKNKRTNSYLNKPKLRSDSVNSLAGQGPKDDQSCENSYLNKLLKEQYVRSLEKYATKGNYEDDIFPPVIHSLFSFVGRKKYKEPNLKWKRLVDIFPDRDLVMWGSDPAKNQIIPSSHLASDYFSLGLNCIKSNKNLLRKMFQSQKPNPQGIYYIKIFQSNVWKYTIVDDYIPVFEEEKNNKITYRPVFIKGNMNPEQEQPIQIWPYLLEKAFAKYYSSYQALQSGNIFDFLQQLTNSHCEYTNLHPLKINITEFFNQQVDMIAFAEDESQNYIPLILNAGKKGRLRFFDHRISQEYVDIEPEELPDFFKHLYSVKINAFTYVGFCPIRQAKESISVRYFSLTASTKCSITLSQKDNRFFQPSAKYRYCWMRLVILLKEQNNQGYRWIDGRYDNQKNMTVEGDFEAGEYYVFVLPEWEQRAYDLNLILRAKTPIRLERKVYEDEMIEEGCADLAQRYGRLNQLNNYICSYNCIHEDMGMIIQNINNERVKGQVRILRSINGLKAELPIEPVNKELKKNKEIEVIIKSNSHFTVVLMMKGGIDHEFFQNFDFGAK